MTTKVRASFLAATATVLSLAIGGSAFACASYGCYYKKPSCCNFKSQYANVDATAIVSATSAPTAVTLQDNQINQAGKWGPQTAVLVPVTTTTQTSTAIGLGINVLGTKLY
jgi:hypothetical protein